MGRKNPNAIRVPPKGKLKVEEAKRLHLCELLDKVFTKYIRTRDKACILTGAKRNVSVSHFFGRAHCPALRWDERNAHLMLNALHEEYHYGNPLKYYRWMLDKYGESELQSMERLSAKEAKYYSPDDLLRLLKYYSEKTAKLKGYIDEREDQEAI